MSSEVIIRNTQNRYTQEITSGKHTLIADEPTELNGNDLGPAPFEYLLSSLGSCTAITLQMYAERKNITLDVINIRLNYHAAERKTDSKAKIERHIHLQGSFDEKQKERLLQIADRCPVHRLISPCVEIVNIVE